MMSAAAAEARRIYKRNWAKRNPDKIKAQQERYWAKRAAEAAAEAIETEEPKPKEA